AATMFHGRPLCCKASLVAEDAYEPDQAAENSENAGRRARARRAAPHDRGWVDSARYAVDRDPGFRGNGIVPRNGADSPAPIGQGGPRAPRALYGLDGHRTDAAGRVGTLHVEGGDRTSRRPTCGKPPARRC